MPVGYWLRPPRGCAPMDACAQTDHSPWRCSGGFTMLEIALVLFLMVGMLSLVIPRMSFGDDLGTVGRKWVGALKSFQELAMTGQKIVRLYVDIDRGMYWPMVIDGKEEKIPLDPIWAMPIALPESIRFADVQVGTTRRETGRMDIFFYPNGRIDQAIEFPLPDEDGRRKLLRLYSHGLKMSDELMEDVVGRTARVSAAFIRELMRRSAQFHIERQGNGELESGDVKCALDEMIFHGGSLNAKLLGAQFSEEGNGYDASNSENQTAVHAAP